MKLGIFDHMQKNDKPERSYADMYANHLEIVEFADQTGMDFYFVAEHHFDLGFSECPSPGHFSAPHRSGQREFVWGLSFMSYHCGTPFGSPKKWPCSIT
jgi:alkanesulfonate monooxygenase SsuD/methylene tetrahydromethanopterin reductase-like flavin-dependent oxidoreductase (luciferase family)